MVDEIGLDKPKVDEIYYSILGLDKPKVDEIYYSILHP